VPYQSVLKQNYFLPLRKNAQAYYNAGVVVVTREVVGSDPGANPTIVSNNASAVKFYNATGSPVRFESKKYVLFI
jgi:hypothetical protein